jgi:ankyrin repeat protein
MRLRGTLILGSCIVVAGCLLVAVVVFFLPRPPDRSQPEDAVDPSALLAAIREGDREKVLALLERGPDVNAPDDTGATPLMHAALNADVEMMNLLLSRGADVNARSKGHGTALLWGLHDIEKVKLLLARGATVEDSAVLVAAALSGGCPTLKLLAANGANLNPGKDGYTPLMAATRGGDLDTVRFLIERGADVKARTRSGYTALYGAAVWPDSAPLVGLLLEQGANPNAQVETSGSASDLFTAAMAAAVRGDADSLGHLLASGADANAQGGDFARTALLGAATSGSRQTVRLLLAKGANVNARDSLGNTPLRWARRRADTDVARLLEEAGGQEPPVTDPPAGPARLHKELGAGSLKRALGKSLPLLQQSGQAFTNRKGCVSCHHQSLVAMAVGLARRHGFEVDEKIATQQRARVLSTLARNRERALLGGGVTDELLPAYALAGLVAEGQKPNPTTDAAIQFLVLRQRKDGSWRAPVYRPPQDASAITFTALGVRGLRLFSARGRTRDIEERIARARHWLVQARPRETEDKTFRLLGLRWAKAERRHIEEALALLVREQHQDGGWAQLPALKSDAYATGQVLFALHEGGRLAVTHPVYRRGVEFLLRTQLADGSWFVQTRSFPLQAHVETLFPHGRSQFISVAATSWATMALARTAGAANQGMD